MVYDIENFYDGLYAKHGFCKITVEGYKRTFLIYAQFSPQRVAQEYNYFCPVFS